MGLRAPILSYELDIPSLLIFTLLGGNPPPLIHTLTTTQRVTLESLPGPLDISHSSSPPQRSQGPSRSKTSRELSPIVTLVGPKGWELPLSTAVEPPVTLGHLESRTLVETAGKTLLSRPL